MALERISLSVEVTGTTNDGQAVNWSSSGSIEAAGIVELRRTVGDTPQAIWDVGDYPFTAAVVINEGTTDGRVISERDGVGGGAQCYSLAVPAGAVVTIPWAWFQSITTAATGVSIAAYTGGTTTFKVFFIR